MIYWGAGSDLNRILQICPNALGANDRIVDRDSRKVGCYIGNHKIEDVKIIGEISDEECVVITSSKFQKEIECDIKELNSKVQSVYFEDLYLRGHEERERYREEKASFIIKDDLYRKRYAELIRGLDEKSINCVDIILQRVDRIFQTTEGVINLFTENEKRILKKHREFNQSINCISKEVYAFEDYYLPEPYFDAGVFLEQCGKRYADYSLDEKVNGNVLDLGGYIGDSALMFSKQTEGTVYVFEPNEDNCKKIRKTIELNNISNVEIVNMAVGKMEGKGYLYFGDSRNLGTLLKPHNEDKQNVKQVEITSVDQFVEQKQINVSVIKADIEGMESDMLQGAVNTLRTQKPLLLIKIHHTARDFWEIKPYLDSLNLGYTFKIEKNINGYVLIGTTLVAQVNGS